MSEKEVSKKFKRSCLKLMIFLESELKNNDWIKWTELLKVARENNYLPKSNKTLIKVRKYLETPHYGVPSFLEIQDKLNKGGRKYDQKIRINKRVYELAYDFFKDFLKEELHRILNFDWEVFLEINWNSFDRLANSSVKIFNADKWEYSKITYISLITDSLMGKLEKKKEKVRRVLYYFFYNAQNEFDEAIFNKKFNFLKYFYKKEKKENIKKILSDLYIRHKIEEIDNELLKRTSEEKLNFCLGDFLSRDNDIKKFLYRIITWLQTSIELVFHNTSIIKDYDFNFFTTGKLKLDDDIEVELSNPLICNFHDVAFLLQEFKENIYYES